MRLKILKFAKDDIPLYFEDFKRFWDLSINKIEDDDLFEIYRATLIFKNWKIAFKSLQLTSFDLLIDELYEDVNSSFFLALFGLYRSSHLHMRSSIELSMQLLYFIHHPIEFQKWRNGDFVIKHDKLCEYLITHPSFKINVKPLVETITKNWKLFSKHIHGEAPIFFQCEKDGRKTNVFSKKDFGIWKSNFVNNIYTLNMLILSFFVGELNRIPETSRQLLQSLLKEGDTLL